MKNGFAAEAALQMNSSFIVVTQKDGYNVAMSPVDSRKQQSFPCRRRSEVTTVNENDCNDVGSPVSDGCRQRSAFFIVEFVDIGAVRQ